MTYQVLARKWRPQDFSAIIGQEPIVTALRNALREGRIAQAYLFAGIRGVGKTTAARVLAKALNCENGPAEDPCNECATCTGITSGADLDVLEIDAATYSKVEQVRELTESLKYGPANDRYKVVVLDEVHRLSRQAFDALLKIVEEPPKHLTFIFATTEVDAVPATILSRCQEFHFRRVPAGVLTAHLEMLCEAEQITASATALRLIARAGEGSVRDSVALLDQLATFGNGVIDDEEAVRLLGGLDTQLFESVLRAVFASDHATIAAVVHEIEDRGWDPRSAFTQLLAYCRDGLHLATQPNVGENVDPGAVGVELPAESAAALQLLVQEAGFENVLRLVHLLLGSELTIKRSEMPGLALEVALLRAAELPKLQRVEQLLRDSGGTLGTASSSGTKPSSKRSAGQRPSATGSKGATSSKAAPSEKKRASSAPRRAGREAGSAPALEGRARADAAERAASDSIDPNSATTALLEHLRSKPSLAAHLEDLELRFSQQRFHVAVPATDQVVVDLFEHHRAFLEEGARACAGAAATVAIERAPLDARTAAAAPEPASATAPSSQAKTEASAQSSAETATETAEIPPAVSAVVEVFGGRVLSQERQDPLP